MRILRASIAVVLLAVFAVGCSEQNVPTASSEVVPTPSFGIGNAPAASGPNIIRGQTTFAVSYFDPETGRSAVIGRDIVAFCTSGAPFDVVNFQNRLRSVHGPNTPCNWNSRSDQHRQRSLDLPEP
jgi:hypothetical protein